MIKDSVVNIRLFVSAESQKVAKILSEPLSKTLSLVERLKKKIKIFLMSEMKTISFKTLKMLLKEKAFSGCSRTTRHGIYSVVLDIW